MSSQSEIYPLLDHDQRCLSLPKTDDTSQKMSRHLPLVRLPPNATIHRFGSPSTEAPSSALLRFPAQGWQITRDRVKPPGWAIVGDAEGRRFAVEVLEVPVSSSPS
jgi:hypothetical protein